MPVSIPVKEYEYLRLLLVKYKLDFITISCNQGFKKKFRSSLHERYLASGYPVIKPGRDTEIVGRSQKEGF